MRTLLVTSRVTFVPDNYDVLVCGLADSNYIIGLIEIDNRKPVLLAKALALIALGARGLGLQLARNFFGGSSARRRAMFQRAGKQVFRLPTINCDAALRVVDSCRADLIINARARNIYQQGILQAPRLGCVNVHHGLLPGQRGTMCDLWALYEGQPSGFTIHTMAEKLDAGAIIEQVVVSTPAQPGAPRADYPAYLALSTRVELETLQGLLARLAVSGTIKRGCTGNVSGPMRRDPSPAQVRAMLRKGMTL